MREKKSMIQLTILTQITGKSGPFNYYMLKSLLDVSITKQDFYMLEKIEL